MQFLLFIIIIIPYIKITTEQKNIQEMNAKKNVFEVIEIACNMVSVFSEDF